MLLSHKHFALQERELDDLIKKINNAVIFIGAVMIQRMWGSIKTGSYSCAHSIQLMFVSFRDHYAFSQARNRDNFSIILFCIAM